MSKDAKNPPAPETHGSQSQNSQSQSLPARGSQPQSPQAQDPQPQSAQEPTAEQFERVMALSDGGAFPRSTALDLLSTLERDQIADILPSQERLHRAITRVRRSARELAQTTTQMRIAALELTWHCPSYDSRAA